MPDAETWAREHVHVKWTPVGRTSSRYVARIEVDGLVFEGRSEGESRKRGQERRAIDEAVAAYLDYIERSAP
jgi:hypothetical protein